MRCGRGVCLRRCSADLPDPSRHRRPRTAARASRVPDYPSYRAMLPWLRSAAPYKRPRGKHRLVRCHRDPSTHSGREASDRSQPVEPAGHGRRVRVESLNKQTEALVRACRSSLVTWSSRNREGSWYGHRPRLQMRSSRWLVDAHEQASHPASRGRHGRRDALTSVISPTRRPASPPLVAAAPSHGPCRCARVEQVGSLVK